MKITALIPNDIISDLKKFSGEKKTKDALMIALTEWINIQKVDVLTERIKRKPIKFAPGFVREMRGLNRKR